MKTMLKHQLMLIIVTTFAPHVYTSVADIDLFKSQANECDKSSINYNLTLSKGTKAGKFYKIDDVHKMADCISHCCGAKKCDLAFMVNHNCYLVGCHSLDSCDVKKSDNSKFSTILSVVSKSGAPVKVKGAGEPAIEGNLQGVGPGKKTTDPFVLDNKDEITTLSAFGTGTVKRSKRSSDILDLIVAVGCGTVAAAVGVAGVVVMTRRLVEKKRSASEA